LPLPYHDHFQYDDRVTEDITHILSSVDATELEQALTALAWSDPAFADDPSSALSQLAVEVPDLTPSSSGRGQEALHRTAASQEKH